jgi:hypothetical protein
VTAVDALFEEFVARWTRDEPVDLPALLDRAGPDSDELAALVDAFLERAPRRAPTPESQQAIAALAARLEREPPLLAARVAARKRVVDLTDAIVAACGLPAEAEQLVRSYYQRLEGGLLDPRGVSGRVWTVLECTLGPAARKFALEGFSPPPAVGAAPMAAFKRAATPDFAAPADAAAPAPEQPADGLRREVEQLFTGGDQPS